MTRAALPGARAAKFAAAVALTGLAVTAVALASPDPVSFPQPRPTFAFEAAAGRTVDIGVKGVRDGAHYLTVAVGDEQSSFIHLGKRVGRYRLSVPAGATEPVAVRIDVDPPASVVELPNDFPRGRRLALRWEPSAPLLQVPAPVPATAAQPFAEATIDETDTYGLRLFGVPVRAAPSVDSALVATVSHGDRLRATCWAEGDRVTNGFDDQTFDDSYTYTSPVWFRVAVAEGEGYVPDARFSRRGNSDRLALPPCDTS